MVEEPPKPHLHDQALKPKLQQSQQLLHTLEICGDSKSKKLFDNSCTYRILLPSS
jgi:hypothetical protein